MFSFLLSGQKSTLTLQNLPLSTFTPHDIFDHQSEYVKSKSLFLTLQEKVFSIPLTFGKDNKTVFGATYQVKQEGNELIYTKPRFFAMKYSGSEWGDLVYEKDKSLNSMRTTGKFLVSIMLMKMLICILLNLRMGVFQNQNALTHLSILILMKQAEHLPPTVKKYIFQVIVKVDMADMIFTNQNISETESGHIPVILDQPSILSMMKNHPIC